VAPIIGGAMGGAIYAGLFETATTKGQRLKESLEE
jgi:hypothetical protein